MYHLCVARVEFIEGTGKWMSNKNKECFHLICMRTVWVRCVLFFALSIGEKWLGENFAGNSIWHFVHLWIVRNALEYIYMIRGIEVSGSARARSMIFEECETCELCSKKAPTQFTGTNVWYFVCDSGGGGSGDSTNNNNDRKQFQAFFRFNSIVFEFYILCCLIRASYFAALSSLFSFAARIIAINARELFCVEWCWHRE